MCQTTPSSAEKVWTTFWFSAIFLLLIASPAFPEGPVIFGAMSS